MSVKYRIAYNDNSELVDVNDESVISGLACGCICIACDEPLIARKGKKNVNHFAHKGEFCSNEESYLHKLGIIIVLSHNEINLPGYGWFSYVRADETPYMNGRYPDVVISNLEERIIIEIKFKHAVDEAKKKDLETLGLVGYEIDISKLTFDVDYLSVKNKVINELSSKKILFPEEKKETNSHEKEDQNENEDSSMLVKILLAIGLFFLLKRGLGSIKSLIKKYNPFSR